MGLASFILVAVLTTFLMLGRVTRNIQNYTEIEAKGRKALELMSREIRAAFYISSYSATSFTASIPDSTGTTPDTTGVAGAYNLFNQLPASGAYQVRYTFDSASSTISRAVDTGTGFGTPAIFISNVQQIQGSNILNYYHRYPGVSHSSTGYFNGYETNLATSATDINQIEVKFVLRETARTVTDATNKVLSARFILRNKL